MYNQRPWNQIYWLNIVDTLSWKQHIELLLKKMCTACYALRNIKHIVPIETLSVIYFAHIPSIISYGINFWSSSSYANKLFVLQKKIISYNWQYILISFIHNYNKHLFDTNNEINKYTKRNNNNNNNNLPV